MIYTSQFHIGCFIVNVKGNNPHVVLFVDKVVRNEQLRFSNILFFGEIACVINHYEIVLRTWNTSCDDKVSGITTSCFFNRLFIIWRLLNARTNSTIFFEEFNLYIGDSPFMTEKSSLDDNILFAESVNNEHEEQQKKAIHRDG